MRVRGNTAFEVAVTSRLTVVPNRRPWVPSNVAVARDCFFFGTYCWRTGHLEVKLLTATVFLCMLKIDSHI